MVPFELRLRPRARPKKNRSSGKSEAPKSHPKRKSCRHNSAQPPVKEKGKRQKMREKDPIAYQVTLDKDAERSRRYRKKIAMDAQMSVAAHEKLERSRELAKFRQQKCREGKKQNKNAESEKKITRKVSQEVRCVHHGERTQIRNCETTRKQIYRASMSKEKREAVNLKRRLQYVRKKLGIDVAMQTIGGTQPGTSQERETGIQVHVQTHHDEVINKSLESDVSADNVATPSGHRRIRTHTPGSLRTSLCRAKSNMPKDANLFADTVMELVLKASPKKAKALAEKKVLFTKKRPCSGDGRK